MQDYLTNLSKKQKITIIICLLIAIIIVFIFVYKYFYDDNSEEQVLKQNESENENALNKNEINSNEIIQSNNKIGLLVNTKKLVVHVIGEVKNPGVVKLEDGARIIDAIEAAGGKTEDADLSKVNLAYVIEDGIQIYIPRIGENKKENEDGNEKGQETYIRENAGDGVITESLVQSEEKEVKVNINTATLEKLQTLPGIGEATAKKIIQYREENGKYETIEDLKKVNGIGESKYNNLKDNITV